MNAATHQTRTSFAYWGSRYIFTVKVKHNHATPCTRKKMHCSTGACPSEAHSHVVNPNVKRLSPDVERKHVHSTKEPGLGGELEGFVRDLFARSRSSNVAMNIR